MATKQNSSSILGDINPPKAIIKLALPATLALLAKAVYNIVDTAYIGMLDSDIALTAVGVTVPLLLIMVSIENIFAAGAAVLAGRHLGAKDEEGASRTVTTIIGLSIVIGVVLCVGGIAFIEPLMRVFGASDASLPLPGLRLLDVCGGPGQSACPEHELRGTGRVLREALFHRRHHRGPFECGAGPCIHV